MSAAMLQTQRSCLAGKAVQTTSSKTVAVRACRPVVARASVEGANTRRAVLGGLLAGVVAISTPAAQAIDILDATKVREAGFDLIYQARDLDLPQSVRDGITQFRDNLVGTKSRIEEASKRINGDLGGYIEKKYWTSAREELRGQVGNLRQDINTSAATLDKASKKKALELGKKFYAKVDDLDFAIRKKSPEKASAAYAEAKSALKEALAALG
jgi:photosystem II oxygen-evolving enhancer protein 3